MSQNYQEMWKSLGLDLESHDALLEVLGQAYQNIYLVQENRPASMGYFDFVMTEVHGLRVKELLDAQKEGRKVIGSFCVFVPEELIMAVNGISVGLCAGAEFAFDRAETILPRNTCSLIKAIFGFKMGRVCPYMEAADIIVGENTCDGKKKSYEQLKTFIPNLYVMDMPQTKSEHGRGLLKAEYESFKSELEKISGKTVTLESLRQGIHRVNEKRKAIKRLNELRCADPVPISGLDALLINQLFFFDDPERFTESVNKVCDELEQRVKNGEGVFPRGYPRVITSGCPMAIPNWKLPSIVETSGAVIVGEESCVGERGTRWLTDDQGDTVEQLMENIVARYFNIDCAIFTPNPSRLEHIQNMVKQYNAQGVIHHNLQFCQPYQLETTGIETKLENGDIPFLRIDTDYSQEDVGQIKTRIEAFVERIKA